MANPTRRTSPPRPRVICFIDATSLFTHLEAAFGSGKYRPEALCAALAGPDRDLVEWRFYAARLPEGVGDKQWTNPEEQRRFLDAIGSHPKAVIQLGRVLVEGEPPNSYTREKGVDVRIIADLYTLDAKDRYDVAIVLSHDECLIEAIEMTRTTFGKRVEIALPEMFRGHPIDEAADGFVEITTEMFQAAGL